MSEGRNKGLGLTSSHYSIKNRWVTRTYYVAPVDLLDTMQEPIWGHNLRRLNIGVRIIESFRCIPETHTTLAVTSTPITYFYFILFYFILFYFISFLFFSFLSFSFLFFFLFFFPFLAAPAAHGSSQTRDRIGAASMTQATAMTTWNP